MGTGLLTAQDSGWDANRLAFNVLLDQQPAGIALPSSADEVAAVVRAAAADGKRVAAQRTGHMAAPLGSLADTVLLRTDGLDEVAIDAEAGTARVGAGAIWREVLEPASELGLAPLHGSSPTVGVAGYTLGGGLSFYGREFGLACNKVNSIELVSAAGEVLEVDTKSDPDLFWALRGGGGNFGVVTSLEFELLEMPERYAGILFFPFEQAGAVLQGWRQWTATVPEQMTSVGRLLVFPPIPEIPEPFRGKSFTALQLIYAGDEASGAELIEPLRSLGDVAMDTMATVPPAGIADLHMDPPEPSPYAATTRLTGDLDAAAIDALVEAVGPGSGSQLVSVELRHLGGALAREADGAGALASLPGSFLAFGVGIVPVPEAMAPTRAWLDAMESALAAYDSGHYLNFCDEPTEIEAAFPAGTVARLRELKRRYDPDGLLHANHPVVAA
ncbi:MAG TPA: FAD-binding oxidoreductase [Solirubrobacterales bacterium]|nr:FAD-binding oxidoreductase [Solirubrobacterales bacterium]